MPKIEVENVNHPGVVRHVDQDKYVAMRTAYLSVLPPDEPGLTIAEIEVLLPPLLPHAQFPDGEKAGWYAKCVQLDLEAKGLVVRGKGSPVRLRGGS
jgi:hypothetical protein